MKRATIADLSREAGVSVATVDRVLNGRLTVREETARKVHEAARRIGYHGANAIHSRILADLPEVHFGIVLQKGRARLLPGVRHRDRGPAQRPYPPSPARDAALSSRAPTPASSPSSSRSMAGKVRAVAATGLDHHEVTRAVADLRARGIPTFSLLSDYAQGVRESYVGLNNLKVGRAVGWLMARMARRPGKVATFVGGHRYHGHELRETGLRSSFREYAPDLEVLSGLLNLEDRQITYETTHAILEKHRDLAGIYCAGGGMEGAIRGAAGVWARARGDAGGERADRRIARGASGWNGQDRHPDTAAPALRRAHPADDPHGGEGHGGDAGSAVPALRDLDARILCDGIPSGWAGSLHQK